MRAIFNFISSFLTRGFIVIIVAMFSMNYIPDHLLFDFPLEPIANEPIDYDSVVPQWNTKLSDGKPEYIQLNNINGPESIAISKDGLIYTGLADGRLVELDPSQNHKMRTVLRIKENGGKIKCQDNVPTIPECGRILQVRFVNDTLYGMEASSGLYMFEVKKGSKILVGPKPMSKVNIYNSFVFDPKDPDVVYMTITTTRWQLVQFMWSTFERDNTGRIVAFNIKTGKRVIVADNLLMVNGIDLDIARDRLIFTETLKGSLSSIELERIRPAVKAAEDGQMLRADIKPIIPILPGYPDNVHIEGDHAYIALPFVRKNGRELVDLMANMPRVRKAIGRATYLAGVLIESLADLLSSNPILVELSRELKFGLIHYRVFQADTSAVIEYNLSTGATRFFGSDAFGYLSEAVLDNKGNIYLGSFRSPFLVKQKMPKD